MGPGLLFPVFSQAIRMKAVRVAAGCLFVVDQILKRSGDAGPRARLPAPQRPFSSPCCDGVQG
jgi:hypothetical protein